MTFGSYIKASGLTHWVRERRLPQMIVITHAAATHLCALLAAHADVPLNQTPVPASMSPPDGQETGLKGAPEGLRILVEKGGCAGMQYAMKLDLPLSGDLIAEAEGARVFLDAASAELLHGAELDYCDDLVGTGFRLQNPNAARSCGCGTSFEPAQLEAEQNSPPQESAASFTR